MMCNRSIELHQYKHVPKLKSRDSMLTLRMEWSGLPQIGVSYKELLTQKNAKYAGRLSLESTSASGTTHWLFRNCPQREPDFASGGMLDCVRLPRFSRKTPARRSRATSRSG